MRTTRQELIGTGINTISGYALYQYTEVEVNGRWDDSPATRDGYYVTHHQEEHHIYKV